MVRSSWSQYWSVVSQMYLYTWKQPPGNDRRKSCYLPGVRLPLQRQSISSVVRLLTAWLQQQKWVNNFQNFFGFFFFLSHDESTTEGGEYECSQPLATSCCIQGFIEVQSRPFNDVVGPTFWLCWNLRQSSLRLRGNCLSDTAFPKLPILHAL